MHNLLLHAPEAISMLSQIEAIFTQYGITADSNYVESAGGDLTFSHIAKRGGLTLDWHISLIPEEECWQVNVNLYRSDDDIWDVFRNFPDDDKQIWTIGHQPDSHSQTTFDEALAGLVTDTACDDTRAFTIFLAIAQTFASQAPSPPTGN